MTPQQTIPLISVGVALVIILLRNSKPRTLRLQWMWVMPVVIVLAIGFGLWGMTQAPGLSHAPFNATAWVIIATGLVLGCVAGWWRGKMITIEKEPDGSLKAQASPLGLILIVALLASRQALRPWLEANAAGWHVNALALQDAFMVFVVGMIVFQRIEMFIRARRVLAGGTDAHVETAPAA